MTNEEMNIINEAIDDATDKFRTTLFERLTMEEDKKLEDNTLAFLGLKGKALRQLNNNNIKTVEALQKFTTPLMMLGCIGAETFEDIINFADKFEIKLHPCNDNLVSFCRAQKDTNIKMYKKGE